MILRVVGLLLGVVGLVVFGAVSITAAGAGVVSLSLVLVSAVVGLLLVSWVLWRVGGDYE